MLAILPGGRNISLNNPGGCGTRAMQTLVVGQIDLDLAAFQPALFVAGSKLSFVHGLSFDTTGYVSDLGLDTFDTLLYGIEKLAR